MGTPEVTQPAGQRAAVFLQGDGRVGQRSLRQVVKDQRPDTRADGMMAAESTGAKTKRPRFLWNLGLLKKR